MVAVDTGDSGVKRALFPQYFRLKQNRKVQMTPFTPGIRHVLVFTLLLVVSCGWLSAVEMAEIHLKKNDFTAIVTRQHLQVID